MNLFKLSNADLLKRTRRIADRERKITLSLILHLREVERRQAYLEVGCPSLHEFAVVHLKLSEASAQRRIQAMRLMRDVPELRTKLEKGEMTLSNAAMIQIGINKARKEREVSQEDKRAIVKECENTTQSQCERKLFTLIPETRIMAHEQERAINEEEVKVTLVLNREVMEKIKELKALKSHKNLSTHELFETLINQELEREKKKKGLIQKESNHSNEISPKSAPQRCEIDLKKPHETKNKDGGLAQLKRNIYLRAKGRCEIPGCNSNHKLEFDHILPRTKGGTDKPENLRLLCRAHNIEEAKRKLGSNLMQKYVKSLR